MSRQLIVRVVLFNFAAVTAIFLLMEGALYSMLRFPALTEVVPDGLKYVAVEIYHKQDRIISPSLRSWHPLVTYTFQPNVRRRITSREFDIEINVNSLGFRDDEESIEGPEIIVLGDSFGLGYGVDQGETFADRLENATRRKVLNTAITSYGTARQVLTFNNRIDTTQVRWLVVQYCENDLRENEVYLRDGKLPITGRRKFETKIAQREADAVYGLGDYLWHALGLLRGEFSRALSAPKLVSAKKLEEFHIHHAQVFLNTLSTLRLPDHPVQLIAFDLWDLSDLRYLRRKEYVRGIRFDSTLFIQAARQELGEGDYPDFLKSIAFVDTSSFLTEKDRFRLDGHIRSTAHSKIAVRLSALVADIQAEEAVPTRVFLTSPEERRRHATKLDSFKPGNAE